MTTSREALVNLCSENKPKIAISKILSSIKFEKIITFLNEEVASSSINVVILLKMLYEHFSTSDDALEKQIKITKEIFKQLNKKSFPTNFLAEVMACLLMQLDAIPSKYLVELADYFLSEIIQNVENELIFELFTKAVSNLMSFDVIPTVKGNVEPNEYLKMILNKLCDSNWKSDAVLFIVKVLRDLPLKEEQIHDMVQKIIKMFHDVPQDIIPQLIYHSLIFTSKSSKQELFKSVIEFFHLNSSANVDEDLNPFLRDTGDKKFKEVEKKTLERILFAAKHELTIGKDFIKLMKNEEALNENLLSPFCFGICLTLIGIHQLEEQIFDLLKSLIIKVFKEDEKRKKSKWVRDLFPSTIDLEKSLLKVATYCKTYWEDITLRMVDLGLVLIDNYTPKVGEHFSIHSNSTIPLQRSCLLGVKLLQSIFKDIEIARESIIEGILNVIVLKVQNDIKHYLDLLSLLVASVPQIVLDCISKFKDVFDYVSTLSVTTAEGLLKAVLPLMKVSLTIKDSLILVLKKSMFSKNLESRKIAVTGFLLILKHFRIDSEGGGFSLPSQIAFSQSYSCSQVVVSTQGRYNVAANEAFCLEILGSLKKCLSQDSYVRQQLYEGIYEVSCRNPQLSNSILDLLFSQFLKYFIRDPIILPPLDLNLCIGEEDEKAVILEPLPYLLHALQMCASKSAKRLDRDEDEDESLSHLLDDVEECLASLTKRLIKSSLEDFDMDKSTDLSGSSEGLKNHIKAKMLLGVYEVFIEYNFTNAATISIDTCNIIKELFEQHQKLSELIQDAVTVAKKSRSASIKQTYCSLFSFKCLASLFYSIICDKKPTNEPGLVLLRQSMYISKLLASSILMKLHQVVNFAHCNGTGGGNLQHIFRHSLKVAKSALIQVNGDSLIADDVLKLDKGKKLTSLCLEMLSQVIGFTSIHIPGQLSSLLEKLDFSPDVISQADAVADGSLVFRLIRRIQRMAIKIITSPDDEFGVKEAQTLMNALSYLIPHLSSDGEEFQQMYNWFSRLCCEHEIKDVILSKNVLAKYLCIHRESKLNNLIIVKLCQDLHSCIGDIDEDVEVEKRSHFKIINEKTATSSFILMVDQIEVVLEEILWCLTKLKSIDENKRIKLQQSVSETLTNIVFSLHELTQTAFPQGMCVDAITRVLTKLYTIFATFVKHLLSLYNQKCGGLPPNFERMVKLSGSHLSPQVYAMITYIQTVQSNLFKDQSISGTSKNKKKVNLTRKNKALKESRSIPNLIYFIEQYESCLILLSKKSKIDLMSGMKRSTARDFRINQKSLEEALLEPSDSSQDNSIVSSIDLTQEDSSSNKSISHSAKRQKIS
ncbi:Fanconi anemia group I protein isoform X5 [Hydra vulgaris]|uniref:Fanconi anemia group I protein isoform X5 n=1 Tax=Hydra vulgaris TaxID=6087 RepID=A0ABM4BIA6_HYDVU